MGVIRHIGNNNGDLYILYEDNSSWSVISYKGATDELESKMRSFFNTKKIRFPTKDYEFDEIIKKAKEMGVQIRNAEEKERQEFIDSFIEEVYLKDQRKLDLTDYLKRNCESVIEIIPEDLDETDFLYWMYRDPGIIGLPPSGTFYKEVRFNNMLSRRFGNIQEFESYVRDGTEPPTRPLSKPDFVYSVDDTVYAIELKDKKTKHTDSSVVTQGKKQSKLRLHFLKRNFTEKSICVIAWHHGKDSLKRRYWHRGLDESNNQPRVIAGSNWKNIPN